MVYFLIKFQSTPLREGRHVGEKVLAEEIPFQSTPLREGRREELDLSSNAGMFQSTPLREGRLSTREDFTAAALVSIHAPP